MKITDNEKKMLNAIVSNEYAHEAGADMIGVPVWSEAACESFGTSAGGVMASLVKKGLAGTMENPGDGDVCWITREGFDVIAG